MTRECACANPSRAARQRSAAPPWPKRPAARCRPIARSATSRNLRSLGQTGKTKPPAISHLSCRNTPPAVSIGTSVSNTAGCCGAGRCRKARRWTPPTGGSRCGSRTIRWLTRSSRAASRPANTEPGRSRSGIAGAWRPDDDPVAALDRGELKFTLHGARLTGGFVLVRLKPRPRQRGDNWLLIKEHDGLERPGADAVALEAERRAP